MKMPRPPSTIPLIHKNFNLPEDIVKIIEKGEGTTEVDKLVSIIRKAQQTTSFDNVQDLIQQGKKLIHAGMQKLIQAEDKRAIIKAQEELDKKKQETRKILELEKIWFTEIPLMLENPKQTREEAIQRWIGILTNKGKEFAHIDSGIHIFELFEEQYDLSKEMEKIKHEKALDNEIEQEVDEKLDEESSDD